MELFARAKVVRLRSHHDKFLYADEDEVRVTQDRDGSSANARWTVEAAPHSAGAVCPRSRYGRYLTASGEPFLLGMTGRKDIEVVQLLTPAPRPERTGSAPVAKLPDSRPVPDLGKPPQAHGPHHRPSKSYATPPPTLEPEAPPPPPSRFNKLEEFFAVNPVANPPASHLWR
ncbi:Actin cross-linking protein [Zea mays]|uniref:Actin cross-linking protein n=1 Tax=Zea mays TaxID=4577 RepID=A0A1D6ER70_MAIZE|nr:Actin cross-linking protein [Zea mays]